MSFGYTMVAKLPETENTYGNIVEADTDGDIYITEYDEKADREIESICISKSNLPTLIRALQKLQRGEI